MKKGSGNNSKFLQRTSTGIVGAVMQQLLNLRSAEQPEATQLEVICQKQIEKAMNGDSTAASIVFDRAEGKPGQQLSPAQAIAIVRAMSLEEYAMHSGVPLRELQKQQQAYNQARFVGDSDDDDNDERPDTGYLSLPGNGDDQTEQGVSGSDRLLERDEPIQTEQGDTGGDDGPGAAGCPF